LRTKNSSLAEEELDEALANCAGSSPDPDHIHYDFLEVYEQNRNLPSVKDWTKAIVIPNLKPDKDAKQSENYQPISLT
jgi:hypothetical protein